MQLENGGHTHRQTEYCNALAHACRALIISICHYFCPVQIFATLMVMQLLKILSPGCEKGRWLHAHCASRWYIMHCISITHNSTHILAIWNTHTKVCARHYRTDETLSTLTVLFSLEQYPSTLLLRFHFVLSLVSSCSMVFSRSFVCLYLQCYDYVYH